MPTTSEEGVDRLKRKRITLRAATTKIINEIGVLLATDPTDIGELEETFDILLLKEASLKELDKEIEPSVECDALEEEISGAEGYAERISVTKTRVNRKLKGQELQNDRASGSSTQGSGSGQTPVDRGQLPTTVKLPKFYCCAFLLFLIK